MVDYSVTPTAVQPVGSLGIAQGIAGGTIAAGMPVRAAGGTLNAAQADSLSNAGTVVGIALNGGAIGQPISYVTNGTVQYNAVFTVGDVVVLSAAAAGGIAPVADLASTNAVVILGVATSTQLLKLDFINSGVVAA